MIWSKAATKSVSLKASRYSALYWTEWRQMCSKYSCVICKICLRGWISKLFKLLMASMVELTALFSLLPLNSITESPISCFCCRWKINSSWLPWRYRSRPHLPYAEFPSFYFAFWKWQWFSASEFAKKSCHMNQTMSSCENKYICRQCLACGPLNCFWLVRTKAIVTMQPSFESIEKHWKTFK